MAVTVRVQVSGPEPVGVRVGVWMVVGVVRWVAWYPWSRLNGGGGRVLGLPEGGQMVPVAPLARDGPLGTLPQLGTDGLQHVGFAYQIAAGKKNHGNTETVRNALWICTAASWLIEFGFI